MPSGSINGNVVIYDASSLCTQNSFRVDVCFAKRIFKVKKRTAEVSPAEREKFERQRVPLETAMNIIVIVHSFAFIHRVSHFPFTPALFVPLSLRKGKRFS